MRTLASVRTAYDRLRARYYISDRGTDGHGRVLTTPPPAADLRWLWTHNRNVGCTHYDDDGDPHTLELDMALAQPGRGDWLALVLLHELSHMRNPAANCGKKSPWWREECIRLANLGAFTREEVF